MRLLGVPWWPNVRYSGSHSYCGLGSVPGRGNRDATSHVAQPKVRKRSKASKHPETSSSTGSARWSLPMSISALRCLSSLYGYNIMIKALMLIFSETKLTGIICKSRHRPFGFIKWVHNRSLHSAAHAGRLHGSSYTFSRNRPHRRSLCCGRVALWCWMTPLLSWV